MLIEAYEVRVFRCTSCGGPVQGGARGLPDNCQFCGADAAPATEVGAFSHEIRVLACDGCAAPLGVPISGGRIECDFCHTTIEVIARREVPLGSGGEVDDEARIAKLRSQDGPAVGLGRKLAPLMRRGGLIEATLAKAEEMWVEHRAALAALSDDDRRDDKSARVLERDFFRLTELVTDYHNLNGRWLVARGLLESALAELRRPRYLQSIYAWLARNAEATGDSASGDAWLSLCDPCPEDLEMDSAVRFTWASIAMRRKDLVGILAALGRTRSEVPLASKFDSLADIYRAHALEGLEGVEVAVEHLCSVANNNRPFAAKRSFWLNLWESVEATPKLDLCRESGAAATKRVWPWWPKPILLIAGCVIFVLALGADVILGPTLWGERLLGYGAIPVGILGSLYFGGYAAVIVSGTREIRARADEVDAKRVSP